MPRRTSTESVRTTLQAQAEVRRAKAARRGYGPASAGLHVVVFDPDELEEILAEERGSITFSLDRGARSPGEGRIAVVISRSGSAITHLGHVRRGHFSTTVDFSCRLSHMVALDPQIRLTELRAALSRVQYQAVRAAAATPRGDGLSPPIAGALRAYLEERLEPEIWRQIRPEAARVDDDPGAVVLQQEADALASALAFSGMDTRLVPAPSPTTMSMLTDLVPQPSEPALIERDLRNFPDMNGEQVREDVFVFTDGAHRLDVINLNATGAETATGVDLLYHHHDWGSMIAVQYKRVDARTHGDRLAVVDGRLPKQLRRMLDLEALTAPTDAPTDYRLGPGFAFVKLARTTPVNPDGAMVKGIYVPARLLASLLDSGALAGPRGGQYIGYDNLGRWFSNTDFTQLVRHGWIGSAGLDAIRLRAWIRQRLRRGRSVLVANHRERST